MYTITHEVFDTETFKPMTRRPRGFLKPLAVFVQHQLKFLNLFSSFHTEYARNLGGNRDFCSWRFSWTLRNGFHNASYSLHQISRLTLGTEIHQTALSSGLLGVTSFTVCVPLMPATLQAFPSCIASACLLSPSHFLRQTKPLFS